MSEPSSGAPPSLRERGDTEIALLYGQHGYMDEEGEFDTKAVIAKLRAEIEGREAEALRDRAGVLLSADAAIQVLWPGTPGRSEWAEQDDPELAEYVHGRLVTRVTSWLKTDPTTGVIQRDLDGENAVVLCQTKSTDKVTGWYVTRSLPCLQEDVQKRISKREQQQMDKDAAVLVMLAQRLPEHAETFGKTFIRGAQSALNRAKDTTATAIEQAQAARGSVVGNGQPDDDEDE